ncbi:lipid A export permease/ATP-binding protein MsbA [Marinobacterium litorale]|jgi:subfamily B ATP-binding cassette protein MsbA|uniref:lipid A export permease/ATP-binding protein MsbA n=1 Tax=Marinobacterium litorale TaxID=404770 RepID=UPI0003FC6D87|nr:lipid A export permease/ATP-binding protein MsbA [Marinobacterium litorale]
MTDTSDQQNKGSGWEVYRRMLVYVKPLWFGFIASFIGYSIYGAGQALAAKWLEMVVDAVQGGAFDQRLWLALAVVGIFLMRGVGAFIGNYSMSYIARETVHTMRTDLFSSLLRLPTHYYNRNPSGEMLSRLTYNVEQVTGAVTNAIKITIREGLTVVGLLGYMVYLNWKLTLIFLAAGPIIGLVVSIASKRMRKLSRRLQSSVGDITSVASEAIRGFQVVRIFGGIDAERARFQKASLQNKRQFMKLVVTQSLNTPLVQLLIALALALLLYAAMDPVVLGGMTTGGFVAFLTAAGMLTKPVRQLTEVSPIIQKGIAAAESLFGVIDEPGEADSGSRDAGGVRGDLTLRNLCFSYPESDSYALNGINLDIPAGKTVALVGRSGSGKTTLASLLPRFNDGWDGELLLDGVPLQEYALSSLREQIALVNQQVVLFNGSIADNIAYGAMAEASEEQVMEAAKAAHVSEFLERLPEGIHTLVGENGVLLSGGQRQRIAIARAILKNSPLLILDEATSALDTESERHIQAALAEVVKGRTTLVIAHRLSTVEKADLIVVMDSGKVVEQGTHQELLEKGGAYAALHAMQFRD